MSVSTSSIFAEFEMVRDEPCCPAADLPIHVGCIARCAGAGARWDTQSVGSPAVADEGA